jgi:hypothetical protein
MEDVGLFYGHSVYFLAIWSIFWHLVYFLAFGIFYGHLVDFSRFGILCQEKSGNPVDKQQKKAIQIKSSTKAGQNRPALNLC